jgi:hypothetical protein
VTGIVLLGVTVYSLIFSLRQPSTARDHWTVLLAFTGLLLGVILFTGFLQLGSRHDVHRFVLYKLGFTGVGGILVFAALLMKLKELLDGFVQDVLLVGAIFLFGASLYLGIMV